MHKYFISIPVMISLITLSIRRIPETVDPYIYACSAVAILIAGILWYDTAKALSKLRK